MNEALPIIKRMLEKINQRIKEIEDGCEHKTFWEDSGRVNAFNEVKQYLFLERKNLIETYNEGQLKEGNNGLSSS